MPGDTLYTPTYEGEGYIKAWYRGRVYDNVDASYFFNGACPGSRHCSGMVVVQPRHEWWVKLRDSKGRIGWTNERTCFDGSDAFGGKEPPAHE